MKFLTKVSVLFIFSLSVITLMACQTEDIMKKVMGVTWVRSFEDDKDGTQAYRPETYKFPPARGREGWTFEENGIVKKQAIGPTDAYVTKQGNWAFNNENKKNIVNIFLKDSEMIYEIISASDSILFVKPINKD